jgi:methylated-DNA-[protein]-cysteine S-methyltransferase
MAYVYKFTASPVGELKLVASDRGLAAILWPDDDPLRVQLSALVEDAGHPVLVETERQLAA